MKYKQKIKIEARKIDENLRDGVYPVSRRARREIENRKQKILSRKNNENLRVGVYRFAARAYGARREIENRNRK